jgi:hypothetical protein
MAEEASLEPLMALAQRNMEQNRRMEAKLDRALDDLADIKARTTGTEEALAGVNRRLDRLDTRADRIERRLELADAT